MEAYKVKAKASDIECWFESNSIHHTSHTFSVDEELNSVYLMFQRQSEYTKIRNGIGYIWCIPEIKSKPNYINVNIIYKSASSGKW